MVLSFVFSVEWPLTQSTTVLLSLQISSINFLSSASISSARGPGPLISSSVRLLLSLFFYPSRVSFSRADRSSVASSALSAASVHISALSVLRVAPLIGVRFGFQHFLADFCRLPTPCTLPETFSLPCHTPCQPSSRTHHEGCPSSSVPILCLHNHLLLLVFWDIVHRTEVADMQARSVSAKHLSCGINEGSSLLEKKGTLEISVTKKKTIIASETDWNNIRVQRWRGLKQIPSNFSLIHVNSVVSYCAN